MNTTVANNPLFPEPSGPNITTNVFNITAGATTDVEFRCLDQATAFSGIARNLFKSVWFYEFNRSYQTPGFSPNVCRLSFHITSTTYLTHFRSSQLVKLQ